MTEEQQTLTEELAYWEAANGLPLARKNISSGEDAFILEEENEV